MSASGAEAVDDQAAAVNATARCSACVQPPRDHHFVWKAASQFLRASEPQTEPGLGSVYLRELHRAARPDNMSVMLNLRQSRLRHGARGG